MKFILLLLICLSYGYDYLLFVELWPASWLNSEKEPVTVDQKTTFNNSYFGIHGLWPENISGTWPQYCNKDKFNITNIQNITKELEIYWTNFHNPVILWQHEYQKHATCAQSDPLLQTEYQYFSTGLLLRRKYDLFTILKNNSISPSNSIKYNTVMLNKILSDTLKYRVVIICDKNNILNEVRICLDKNLLQFDCPNSEMKEECQADYIIYNMVF